MLIIMINDNWIFAASHQCSVVLTLRLYIIIYQVGNYIGLPTGWASQSVSWPHFSWPTLYIQLLVRSLTQF